MSDLFSTRHQTRGTIAVDCPVFCKRNPFEGLSLLVLLLFVVVLAFIGIGEITRFLFGLLLLCADAIQLRFIKHDLNCVVLPQVAVPIENGTNLFL